MRSRIWSGYLMMILVLGWSMIGVAEEIESSEHDISAQDDDEVVEGPGGRPLRTDYPGTQESLQARMDTHRIEGMEIEEGESPEEVYDLRVRELETEIDDLKERVFRSKSRLVLLKETVLAGNLAGSRAVVSFENNLGASFDLRRVIFSVDGRAVFSSADGQGVGRRQSVEIFTGSIAPGMHTISASLDLQGSGYGVFSYARGYEFDLRFSCQFTAEEGHTTRVTVRAFEEGGIFTAQEERPSGECYVSMVPLSVEDVEDTSSPELQ